MRNLPLIPAFLLVVCTLPSASAAEPIVVVNREQVNIREDATTQSRRIEVLRQGDAAEELRRHVGWVEIRMEDGRIGWVHGDLVQERYFVEGQGVRVRSGPGTGEGAVTMVYSGQELGKLGRQGNWFNVQLADGRIGWLHSKFVRRKTIEDLRAVSPQQTTSHRNSQDGAKPSAEFTNPDPEFGVGEVPFALRRNPYAEGLQLEAAGDYAAALTKFEEVLQGKPNNINALYHAAQAHIQLGQLDEAREKLYTAIDNSGGRRDLFMTLSEVYRRSGMADSSAKYEQLFSGERPRRQASRDSESSNTRNDSRAQAESTVAEREIEKSVAVEEVQDFAAVEPVDGNATDSTGEDRLHLFAIGSGALLLILVAAIWIGARLGRRAPTGVSGQKEKTESVRRKETVFSKTLDRESVAASQGRVSSEEEEELDRQIDAKWMELRQRSELFAPDDVRGEEGHSNSIFDHVGALREALDLQDERAIMYADIVRLQNMKIESMNEEIKLLRKQRK